MNLNLMMNDEEELKPRITVFGVGGAGGNAVNNMIQKQLDGVEFVVANTDAQALQQSRATSRIQIGPKVTEGLGAGAKPTIGAKAAEETIEDIVDHLMGAHMCFITAGMGGGTGTGAAPIIAQAAREMGILTVGVVTKPFQFEGTKRMRQAEEGVEALQKVVDTLIIIPNQNLFRLANEKTTFTDAFALADDVLYQGVKGVTDLMVKPGLINLDFADVRSVMDEMGKAMMGTGEASGENRAQEAAERAIANPLLDEISLNGARGVLINITGGYDMTLFELDEAANVIRDKVDADANIIVGSTLDPDMDGTIRVSVVATGIDAAYEHWWAEKALLSASVSVRRIEDYTRQGLILEDGRWIQTPVNDGDALTRSLELEAKFPLSAVMEDVPEIDLRASVSRNWSEVDAVPGPDNRLDQQVPLSATLGIDYKTRDGKLSTGASFAFKDGGPVRVNVEQSRYQSVRRDLDVYALWKFNPKYQLRLAASNLLRQDGVSDSRYTDEFGTLRRTSFSEGHTMARVTLESRF